MKKLLVISTLVTISGLAGNSHATPVSWGLSSGTCTSGVGNECTFTNAGKTLTARAYATNDNPGLGLFVKATLKQFNGGLGVKSPGESDSSPQHAVDNDGKDELIVFEFGSADYLFTDFQIGWKQNDADIRAWIGGDALGADYNFFGKKFSDLSSLGFTAFDFLNVPINNTQNFGINGIAGRYLILAAAPYNARGYDKNLDYFKISRISGNDRPTPPVAIPESGTLALLGIALAGLGVSRARSIRP